MQIPPIFRLLTALSQGYGVSQFSSYGQEVAAGGTTNKIWTFLIQYILILVAFSPLYFIFPAASFTLNVLYYSSIGVAAALSYIASICHMNQVQQNTGDISNVQTLPFDLHKSQNFTRLMLFLNLKLTYALYALYAAVLLLCLYAGFYLFPIASVCMIITDQLYQKRWFPKFLETPYFLLSTCLQISVGFGFSNWFWIGLNVVSVTFFIWDYVQTHVRGVQSASTQFPIASEDHQFSFDEKSNQNHERPANRAELSNLLNQLQNSGIKVTFNHFRHASVITDQLIGRAPCIDFEQYNTLFNQLDFASLSIQNSILNEMALHDKFHQKSFDEHRTTLNLPANTEDVDVQIAYLKQEMGVAVERLKNPSYKALNNQQMNILVGQARMVLDATLKTKNNADRQNILLSVAIRTGNHCNRMYIETFSELFHAHAYKNAPLTLRDNAALLAQSVREDQFKKYYYHTLPMLRNYLKSIGSPGYLLSADRNDYHAYENFAVQYGGFFYLQNQSLSIRVRDPIDILMDYLNKYGILKVIGPKCLFSDHYNGECLIDAVVDGRGKLHKVFQEWCSTLYPGETGAYIDFLFDDDMMPLSEDTSHIRALAKLMLLDLGLVELTEPFLKISTVAETSTYSKLLTIFGFDCHTRPTPSPVPSSTTTGWFGNLFSPPRPTPEPVSQTNSQSFP